LLGRSEGYKTGSTTNAKPDEKIIERRTKKEETSMSKEKEPSEFGKGLVICLVKFSQHYEGLAHNLEHLQGTISEDHIATMNMDAASDHLYEIEVPKGREWTTIRKKVEYLQDKSLEMGHGITDKNYTAKEAWELYHLAGNIALLIDKKLGLKPEEGV